MPSCINNPGRVNSRREVRYRRRPEERERDFLSSRSPHVPMMFNAISLIAATSFPRSRRLASRRVPSAHLSASDLSARKSLGRSAQGNKLQLLESTFELRLGRARYDNQRNPVSRVATVMNLSDVAGSTRKEDSPSGGKREREYSAMRLSRPSIPLGHARKLFNY